MDQNATNVAEATSPPNGRRRLLVAQIAAAQICAAAFPESQFENVAVAMTCVGVLHGEIFFLATLAVLSRLGLLTRVGLLTALYFDISLLAGKAATANPFILLLILSVFAAGSLFRFAGLTIAAAAPPGAVAARWRPMQFGLWQLLAAVTVCALAMGALRLLLHDYSARSAYIGFQTLFGSLTATWVIYGRTRWTWRIAGLGLTLLLTLAVNRCIDRFNLNLRIWPEVWIVFIAQILSATAMLGFARWCGYRGHWIGEAAPAETPDAVNASENARPGEHS